MAFLPYRIGLFSLAVLAVLGCAPLHPEGKSPLVPARMSPDSVVLDIFFARFPQGQEDLNGPLWNEIDEQHFPTEVRRRLAENGFRVGMVGDRLPDKLVELLELKGQLPTGGAPGETVVTNLESEPHVVRRHLQLRADQRSEIITTEIYETLPVLTCDAGEVSGRPYSRAQGLFVVKSYPDRDGRVRLELTPELQFGEERQRFSGRYGAFKLEAGRDREDFDKLAISATLAPGNMIVMSSLPERSGSLGCHFFRHQTSGKTEQKLMVIRLSQTQHDDLFNPKDEEALPLELKADVQEGPTERPRPKTAKAKK